ncbi:MAG: hypothetical protein JWM02_3396 [Frankiales bacterium]|nr:hypothetical protein [Frankiales bacterium]
MSVLMTLRISGDATKLEGLADRDPAAFPAVSARAKEHGMTSHRFYATEDQILVVDEWPNEQAFREFFETSPEIGGFMQEAGVTSPPEATFWRRLNLGDEVG